MYGREKPSPRGTPQFEDLVNRITSKADGVFLWVSLVLNGICETIRGRQSWSSLLSFVEMFPSKLEDYYRELIWKRIDRDRLAVTAIALKCALVCYYHAGSENLDPLFAALWTLSEEGADCFLNEKFAQRKEFSWITPYDVDEVANKVKGMLALSCKDLLRVSSNDELTILGEPCPCSVGFLHRTVFDFLSTDEMKAWIGDNIPQHLKSPHLYSQLVILSLRVILANATVTTAEQVFRILFALYTSLDTNYLLINPCPGDTKYLDTMPTGLVEQHGLITLHYVRTTPPSATTMSELPEDTPEHMLPELIALLIYRGLHLVVTDIVSALEVKHGRAGLYVLFPLRSDRLQHPLLLMAIGSDLYGKWRSQKVNMSMLKRFLEIGRDPNEIFPMHGNGYVKDTPWEWVLRNLVIKHKATKRTWPIVRSLIEFGADLETEVYVEGSPHSETSSCPRPGTRESDTDSGAFIPAFQVIDDALPVPDNTGIRKMGEGVLTAAKAE